MATNEELLHKYRIQRGSLKARLTTFNTFLQKSIKDPKNAKINEIKARLNSVSGMLEEFLGIQLEIEYLLDDETEVQNEFATRESFENNFHSVIAEAEQFLESLEPKNSKQSVSPSASVHSSIPSTHSNNSIPATNTDVLEHIASTSAHNVSIQNQTSNDFSGVKLPTINLPTFSGEPRDWLQFKDSFQSLINNNLSISNVQKFHYLKRSLQGEAFETIANLQVTNNNFAIAWDLLCDQYTDKRVLLHEHTKSLFNIQPIKNESAKALSHIVDHVKMHLRSLEILGEPTSSWDTLMIYLITNKLDSVTIREWESKDFSNSTPSLEDLFSFLKQKSKMLKKVEEKNTGVHSSQGLLQKSSKGQNSRPNKSITCKQNSFHSSLRSCPVCKQTNHKIYTCVEFLNLPISEKLEFVKKSKLCENCLNSGHQIENCKFGHCKKCPLKHHTLLHSLEQTNTSEADYSAAKILASFNLNQRQVLLATVVLQIVDSKGNFHDCRALLDPGSQSNFIRANISEKLGLVTNKINMTVSGAFRVESKINSSCKVQVHSKHNAFSSSLTCLIVPEICDNIPEAPIEYSTLQIPQGHKLADPDFHIPNPIDILIGADLFWESLCIGQVKLSQNGPFLHKTKFGWIVAGPLVRNLAKSSRSLCNLTLNSELQKQLSRFWEIEECSERLYSPEEQACESNFVSTHSRAKDGRFIVTIPLKESDSKLGDSRAIATQRFYNLERKLQKNAEFRKQYISFMLEYESLGHMTKVQEPSSLTEFFLPHHGVLKTDSLTTKLRVVFDGSCATSTGLSLNDIQMVGPTIQNDIFSILLRFRQHKYVVSADICKMYRQVLIHHSQRRLQQIFWRNSPDEPLQIFQLNTVTYGTSSASYLAIRSLIQLSKEFQNIYPKSSEVIKNDFYVDDLLTGSDCLLELIKICREASFILTKGCFELRKWISNDSRVLTDVSDHDTEFQVLDLGSKENAKTLGICWSSVDDHMLFNINLSKPQGRITKRTILSAIAQIYDPLGLLSACIIVVKVLLQRLWLERLSWDESVPADIHTKWVAFQDELPLLNNLRISRHIKCDKPVQTELHTFCDASESAYGACAYIRTIDQLGFVHTHLLCAKSKVAPLKTLTVPRLELCGALIAARISQKIQTSLTITFDNIFHWTDSTIVLGWIHMPPSSLKTFVANRVSEIQSKTNSQSWHHVGTNYNPADLVSRGTSPTSLISSKIWWQGPGWLSLHSSEWPVFPHPEIDLPDTKPPKTLNVSPVSSLIDFQRFSNFNRLQRSMAYCARFIQNLKSKNKLSGSLQSQEISRALQILIKEVQGRHFSAELEQLSKNKYIHKRSKIQSLCPFLDDDGVIRVGGRLKHADGSFNKLHPILLPHDSTFTKLLFIHEHNKLLHTGPNHLLASIRETYWPISGRSIARKTVHNCIRCFRARPRLCTPLMGDLPKERVTPAPPFYCTGVDYAGPFSLRDKKGRNCKIYKAWVCLFICLVTKAVHLEVATDLTTDSFISCFRRFISRRGKPARIFSDNGTNFLGAKNEINSISGFLSDSKDHFNTFSSQEGIEFKFIPACSPHFGGLWEAGVKSMKALLKRSMFNNKLIYEDFQTLLIQIEAILNSRPLTPLNSDPADLTPITPSHFLIGRTLTSLPDPDLTNTADNRLNRFQHVQKMQQNIWSRWSKEYISEMQQRQKWHTNGDKNIQLNQLVLIRDVRTPPLSWPLGRVSDLHPGQDGVVRVVTVKTLNGEVRRAVKGICPLPVEL